jgi:hypothetical protein
LTVGTPDELPPGNASRTDWLPPLGRGNGLNAPAWAPVADVPHELVDHLLDMLADADVPAFVGRVDSRSTAGSCRVWVGSRRYATAKDVLQRGLSRRRTSGTKTAASRPTSPNTNQSLE